MATSYLSPGVYIEEVDRGSKPIEAVGTSTAAFIGESSVGPTNEAVLITNWAQYTRTFGDFSHSTLLAHALYGFFNNGGTKAFVCNVSPRTVSAEQAAKEAEKKEAEAKKAAEGGKPAAAPAASAAPAAPAAASPALYIGKDEGPGRRTGLNVFNDIPEISLVAAPGQTDSAIQDAVISHCENNKYRFAILDSAEELGRDGIAKMPKPRDSQYAAYYFPWIQVYDPEKGNIFVPPSGHMAGIYARSDAERGVHKAPANEIVRGALGLKYTISRAEQDFMNPRGINCIRNMGDRGIRVWGARTVSSDPSWRYINVRRLFLMVEQSIEIGTQWVVFEPNDETLWKRVTRNITAFLLRIYNSGALMGKTPEEAFYVKCDSETNPPEVVDAGQMVCEIGIAPVKPAEFVIFRIGQMAGQAK
ncbi:MAG TPA: phage tail sheath family protein [Myxococcales bacterium]|nr:phage tail sheath family protein [Myxococcales bacterium]